MLLLRSTILTLFTLMTGFCFVASPFTQQSGPMHTVVDFPPPPRTLHDLWQRVDLIVRAAVVKASGPYVNPADRHPSVRRDLDLRVIEVIKNESQGTNSSLIRIQQAGGASVLGDREVTTEFGGLRRLNVGDQAIFLLKRDSTHDFYFIAFGSNGLFAVDPTTNIVQIPNGDQALAAFQGQTRMGIEKLVALLKTEDGA